ncbi:hypothetical protein Plhal703r1_c09g0050121 [Plasmopara halstedii]
MSRGSIPLLNATGPPSDNILPRTIDHLLLATKIEFDQLFDTTANDFYICVLIELVSMLHESPQLRHLAIVGFGHCCQQYTAALRRGGLAYSKSCKTDSFAVARTCRIHRNHS